MEVEQALSARQHQFSELNDELERSYVALKKQYHKQKWEAVEYKYQARYWHAQFDRQKTRETELISEIENLKAALRKREQQLFGKSSEQSKGKSEAQASSRKALRKRGQQPGKPGHSRRPQAQLPVVDEDVSIVPESAICFCCGLPLIEMPDTEDSRIFEVINVKAYQRHIHRQKYRRSCACPVSEAGSQIVTAPVTEKLIAKSNFGISIWALLLIKKYVYQQPLNRSLQELSHNGLPLAAGTMVGGFQKILPLLMAIYDLIVEKNLEATHWHADETSWKVFEYIEDKANQRWYLWIFKSKQAVVYKLDPRRAAKVPLEHFGTEKREDAVLSVDRYSAYKVVAAKGILVLAFCWAHVRRDFLSHAKGYPEQEAWALGWVTEIGNLYHLNNERVKHPVESNQFAKINTKLKKAMIIFKERLDSEVIGNEVSIEGKAILQSLHNHFDGLSIFVDKPEIPMDNNPAESGLRSPVVGRKNYYGSGSVWAGELSAVMFSIVATLKIWNINPHTWLLAYFEACAKAGASVPPLEILQKFLPWNMSDARRALFEKPPAGENSS